MFDVQAPDWVGSFAENWEHVEADTPKANRRRAALALGAVAGLVVLAGLAISLVHHPSAAPAPPSSTTAPAPTPVFTGPVTGLGFSVADDPAAHQVVIFGGVGRSATTWLWDGTRWSLASPATSPQGRSGAAAAYDPATRTVMLFGGSLPLGQNLNDTWAWNGTTWRRLDSGVNGPPVGSGAQMAWDGASNEMILVTTAETTYRAETWAWNGTNWTRQTLGNLTVTVFGDVIAYDPVSRTVLLVSPVMSDNGKSVTLSWNGSSWRLLVADGPEIGGMAVAPQGDTLFACGVSTYSASFKVDSNCWEWTGSGWLPSQEAVPPDQVTIEAEVTDTQDARLVMFGWLVHPQPGAPQPLHSWYWDGVEWVPLG